MSTKNSRRESRTAAQTAENERARLQESTRLSKERSDTDKKKAQRLLMRSLRAGAGGFFETDTPSSKLGGSGTVL